MSEKRLLRALNGETVDRTPIWLMRQAGRCLPEYRALKKKYDFLALAKTPELSTEVTLQPIRRFAYDGAILFADILTPLLPLDFGIDFAPGPKLAHPLREEADLRKIEFRPEALQHVVETIRNLRHELPAETTLIGFAGAPFTLAAYLLDGGGSREHAYLRAAVHGNPDFFRKLTHRLAELTRAYLDMQIEAGVEAVQLFDTWAGLLAEDVYRDQVLPGVEHSLAGIQGRVPTIYLVKDGAHLLEASAETGSNVLSLDWRISLDEARARLGPHVPVQGNLDPGALLGTPKSVKRAASKVLDSNQGRAGHVFNLGHGLLPQTPLENLEALIDTVRNHAQWSAATS